MRSTRLRGHRAHRLGGGALLLFVSWLAVSVLTLSAFAVAPARAASPAEGDSHKVVVFEDVTIGPGEIRENVVVVGGDVVVQGTIENVLVVVGGDLVVAPDGRIGTGTSHHSDDTALVSVFGDVTIDPGAVVLGRIVDVAGGGSGAIAALVADPVMQPWDGWRSIAGWIGSTVFIILVAVVVTAVAPRQVAFTSERARRHLFSSLGWGALGLIVIVPLVTVVLVVTLIGILALLPWWLAVAVALLFGYVSVGALIGRLVMGRREDRGRVMLAAVLGVIVLSAVRWVPVAGAVVTFVALLLGLGATITSVWEWRRQLHARRTRMQPPGYGPGAPGGRYDMGRPFGGPQGPAQPPGAGGGPTATGQ